MFKTTCFEISRLKKWNNHLNIFTDKNIGQCDELSKIKLSEVVKRMDTLDKKIDDKTSAATAELQQTVSVKFLQKSADFRESRILT